MAGVGWVLCEAPSNILWVMPSIGLARSFSTTRWLPLSRFSPALSERMPAGTNRRSLWTTLQQVMGGSVVNFVGANSPANLASRPARVVVLDEVDKFPRRVRGEADAVNLAEQRTKNFSRPLRVKCSTPTQTDGLIWCEFMKGDQRRFNLPCPFCGKLLLLAWSEQFTILPKLGNEAWIQWEPDCHRGDGSWDLERVASSTWARCPHCQGKIPDNDKSKMLRLGQWVPTATATAARGFRSYHLSSLYAPGVQTSWGRLAVAFLQAKLSFLGLQGFINGTLAEPFESQDTRGERLELMTTAAPLEGAIAIMTVDCQAVSPYFWWAVRSWDQAGNSRLVAQGHLDEWEALRAKQLELAVDDNHVAVDSGYSTADVYKNCLRWGKLVAQANGVPAHIGWTPTKGREKEARWLDAKTKQPKPWMLGSAALPDTQVRLPLLEYGSDHLLGLLAKLRRGPAECGGIRWEVTKAADQEYWRHLDSKIEKEFTSGRTGKIVHIWTLRSKRWPDHLLDCEVMQVAMAMLHRRLPWAKDSMKRHA